MRPPGISVEELECKLFDGDVLDLLVVGCGAASTGGVVEPEDAAVAVAVLAMVVDMGAGR